MSSLEEVLLYDSNMRIAMSIGDQAGIKRPLMQEWYGDVIFGHITLTQFFSRILIQVTDPELRAALLAVFPTSLQGRTPQEAVSRSG